MNTHNVSDWFQIVASIGVLLGLLLVGYELRRNEGINIGTLTYQTLENQQNSLLAIAGENPAAALTSSCPFWADFGLVSSPLHVSLDWWGARIGRTEANVGANQGDFGGVSATEGLFGSAQR